jgi:cell division protein ZapA (FtsZ GTPase activity inhibitor)
MVGDIMKEGKKRSVKVVLMGTTFSFKTEQDEGYVQTIADYVNREMETIRENRPSASLLDISMLSIMNIAEKYFDNIEQQKASVNTLLDKSNRLISFIDERTTS